MPMSQLNAFPLFVSAGTGMALALLAQEKFAKAFVLALLRNGILPWTEEVRRA
jgi:hypothetical protein